MACTTISDALGILHDRKLQQHGLQRLDSPTEAALVAQLANRQRGETVIVSVGDPKPAGEAYCFAQLAPPHIRGSDKMKHNYVLAQHAYYCGLKLAGQKGLSTPRQLREQQQQEPQPIPCSPAEPAPCEHAEVPDTATPNCRTPLSQLRAEQQQQHEDSSPCNNIVRRLAANIKAGSPALRVTLEEYSSQVRRTTSSFRSRVGNTSDGSQDEHATPLASPGRAWAQHTAGAQLLEPLSLDQQDVSTAQVSEADWAAADTAGSPAATPTAALRLSDLQDMQRQVEALDFGSGDLRCHSPCSVSSEGPSAQDVVGPPVGLPAVAVPALEFKGFGAASAPQQAALAATDSIQLETPRLEPRWAPAGSNCSSSNGTAGGSSEQFFSIAGGSCDAATAQGGAAGAAGAFSLPGAASAAMLEQLNEPLPAVSVHVAAGAGFSTAWDVATGCVGASVGAASSAVGGVVSAQQDDYDSPGYWSCDEDDDCDTAAAAAAAAAQSGRDIEQLGEPPLTPAGAQAMPAAEPAVEGEPSQLTLSPLLLKQLTQSFHEAGEPDPPHPADDDATTCWTGPLSVPMRSLSEGSHGHPICEFDKGGAAWLQPLARHSVLVISAHFGLPGASVIVWVATAS